MDVELVNVIFILNVRYVRKENLFFGLFFESVGLGEGIY
jgi:hypothetical protein